MAHKVIRPTPDASPNRHNHLPRKRQAERDVSIRSQIRMFPVPGAMHKYPDSPDYADGGTFIGVATNQKMRARDPPIGVVQWWFSVIGKAVRSWEFCAQSRLNRV